MTSTPEALRASAPDKGPRWLQSLLSLFPPAGLERCCRSAAEDTDAHDGEGQVACTTADEGCALPGTTPSLAVAAEATGAGSVTDAAPAQACPVSGQLGGTEDCPFAHPKPKAKGAKKGSRGTEKAPGLPGAGGKVAAAGSKAEASAPPPKSTAAPAQAEGGKAADKAKSKAKAKPSSSQAPGNAADQPKRASSSSKAGAQDEHACPAVRMVNQVQKVSYLQRIKAEKAEQERRAKELRPYVEDMLAGKLAKEAGGGQPRGDMRIHMPTPYERENMRKMILEQFRSQYRKIGKSEVPSDATGQYNAAQSEGLAIKEGHRPMPRPQGVTLPKDFRKPVGTLTAKELAAYGCSSERKLVSIYGDIFDVSDRPDKYGEEGPYGWMTGNDLTWGFVSGKDVAEQNNQFYDMWKIAPKEFQENKLRGLLAWVAFYEYEYGQAVGRLAEYQKEAGLKGPPMEDAEACCVM